MNFLLSAELQEFREVLRRFLAETKDSGDSLWKKLGELGAFSAPLSEDCDGLGFGALATQVVLEETAAALLTIPVFETVALAAPFLGLVQETDRLKKIAAGDLRCTAAFSSLDKPAAHCVCQPSKDGTYAVSGELDFVPSVDGCDEVLFVAQLKKSPGEFRLFGCAGAKKESGLKWQSIPTLDLERSFSQLTLDGVSLRAINETPITAEALDELRATVAVAFVAEMVGAADRALNMTVDYVKTRQQFARPIGSFQAIQHKLADMHVKLEQAKSLGRFAAWCVDHDRMQMLTAADAAKAFASETLPEILEEAIQAHGGIGFTFEYSLHRYLRRVLTESQIFLPKNTGYMDLASARLAK